MGNKKQTQDKQQAKLVQVQIDSEKKKGETAVISPIHSLQRAYTNPRTLSPSDAQTLQRTIGNQALGRLTIQRKMTLGPVGDKYEQEADTVAKQVVSKLKTTSTQAGPTQTAQRQEEEELQMKPLIQRQEEEELQMKSIQRQEEEDELQMKPLSAISSLQRQEEEELQMKPLSAISSLQRQVEEELQAKGDPMLAGGELSSDVESSVQSAKSGGAPLSNNVRQPMEGAFNADFSSVKVHTGSQSDSLNRSLNARAFTSGQDIFFRSGEYNPSSSGGQELLAHELTHTIQQGSAIQRKIHNHKIQSAPPGRIQADPKNKSQTEESDENEVAEPVVDPDLADSTPDKHVVTLSVHRDNQDYENFQKARWWLKQVNKLRTETGINIQKPRKPKYFRSKDQKNAPPEYWTLFKKWTKEEMKLNAAFDAIMKRSNKELPDLDEAEDIVDNLVENQGGGGTGHAWVKFQTFVGSNMRSIDSFGFGANGNPTHPAKPVPGIVNHPDYSYDDSGGETAFVDYKVDQKDYNKSYQRGLVIEQNPPPYTTFDYNCTKFARELVKEAGQSFPGPMNIIPRIGTWYKTYNPTSLFTALKKKQNQLDTYYSISEAQNELAEKLEDLGTVGNDQRVQDEANRWALALGHDVRLETDNNTNNIKEESQNQNSPKLTSQKSMSLGDFAPMEDLDFNFMDNNNKESSDMKSSPQLTSQDSMSLGDFAPMEHLNMDFMGKDDKESNDVNSSPQLTSQQSMSLGDFAPMEHLNMDFMGKDEPTDENETNDVNSNDQITSQESMSMDGFMDTLNTGNLDFNFMSKDEKEE